MLWMQRMQQCRKLQEYSNQSKKVLLLVQVSVLNVLSFFFNVCCKCVYRNVVYVFTHILQVFYLDVVYVCNNFKNFSCVFASVSDECFKCFIVFRRMLQLLHMDVSKLDWELHLPPRLLLPYLGAAFSHIYCKCFILMLRMFEMVSSFFQVFWTNVSNVSLLHVCGNCCIWIFQN
jgi:hypothetical protein